MLSQRKDGLRVRIQKLYTYAFQREWLVAIGSASALIVIGALVGERGLKTMTINPSKIVHYSLEPSNKLSFLANWDGVRYISIALHGYRDAFLTGWFPLYPLAIRALHSMVGSALLSALLISWVCLAGAIYYYIKIIKLFYKVSDNFEAMKATLLFIFFPSSIYLIAAYSESLFALLSLAAIYYALQRRYLLSALLVMLTTATRINGIFLVVFVALILLEEREKLKSIIVTLVIGCLGLVGYMTYLFIAYHNPLEFIYAQKDHHWLQTTILTKLGSFSTVDYILFFIIFYTVAYWWKRRRSFAIYSACYLLIPLLGGQFGGYLRYSLMIFPIQLMLYEYYRRKNFGYVALCIVLAIAWTYVLLRYAAGYVIS